MYHPEFAHFEGDPRHDEAVAIDDAYRRSLIDNFDSKTVDAIMHGELMDGKGRVITALGDAFMTSAYAAGAEVVTEFESVNPLEIVAADIEAAANPDEGGKYEGLHEVRRRKVDLSSSSSKNPKRRTNPDMMMRPSSEQMHQRLMNGNPGRPRKGAEVRERMSTRVAPETRNILMSGGIESGSILDTIATLISRGMTSSQIREALQNAEKSEIISASLRTGISSVENIEDLPMCA